MNREAERVTRAPLCESIILCMCNMKLPHIFNTWLTREHSASLEVHVNVEIFV